MEKRRLEYNRRQCCCYQRLCGVSGFYDIRSHIIKWCQHESENPRPIAGRRCRSDGKNFSLAIISEAQPVESMFELYYQRAVSRSL